MLADQIFKGVAWRRGAHWQLSENERKELGVAMMQVVKQLPAIPEEKIGKWGAFVGAGMVVVAIVQPRVEQDERNRKALPTGGPPGARVGAPIFERVNGELPPDVQQLVDEGKAEVRFVSPEEYAAMVRAQAGGEPDYPTLAATDETLLDRVIESTQGVDQGTLANEARSSGRLMD